MKSVDKVRQHLKDLGLDTEVIELAKSTRTAQLAAEAVGAPLGSIVKSLVFLADGRPVLVLVAGDERADPKRLGRILKARRVMIADAERVREATGFAIGGVPPVDHKGKLTTLIDESLGRFDILWRGRSPGISSKQEMLSERPRHYAAAGAPNAIFPISYEALVRITEGQVADVTEG